MRRAAGSPEAADGDRVTTTVSYIESPSVQIAWRLRMAEIGIELPFVPFFEKVQRPDPRVPKGDVEVALWAYDGTRARAALGEPDAGAAEAVASIARTHPLDWVPRMQTAAALVLAWHPRGFLALRSIALGPVDWTVDAAIVAL